MIQKTNEIKIRGRRGLNSSHFTPFQVQMFHNPIHDSGLNTYFILFTDHKNVRRLNYPYISTVTLWAHCQKSCCCWIWNLSSTYEGRHKIRHEPLVCIHQLNYVINGLDTIIENHKQKVGKIMDHFLPNNELLTKNIRI